MDAAHRRAAAVLLCVEGGLEGELGLVLLVLDLLVGPVVAELGFVQVVLDVLVLLPEVLLHGAEVALDDFALDRLVQTLVQVRPVELLRVRLLVLAEPVVQHAHRHVFVVCTRLECALFHFFFLVLESNVFQLDALLGGPLVQSGAVLGPGQRFALLRLCKLVRLRSHLRLECFLFADF